MSFFKEASKLWDSLNHKSKGGTEAFRVNGEFLTGMYNVVWRIMTGKESE